MTFRYVSNKWPISIKWVSLACLMLVFISVFQDYYYSLRNQSAFYLSESLLFNSFWLFFIPGLSVFFSMLHRLHKRAWYQYPFAIVVAILVHWGLYDLAVFTISFLFHEHAYSLLHTMKYSISSLTLSSLLIYGIGSVIHARRPAPSIEYLARIQVKTGSQTIPIDVRDIICIQSESPYVAIHTQEKQYLHSDTLKSLEKRLNPEVFVRIHKSCLINSAHVKSFASRNNGDYDVVMANDMSVRVSRNYAASFKSLL
ncbi:LytR/AlgR family response regulator transcription factor [Ekhidna sp.]|uniref:LytR/AlgR family response regulator transcription factor n=1 Tax=Ekhidna sp. TaxID=2608089 RepID=UPI003518A105